MKLDNVPTVLLVASGKGGVGKTTVATDIARTASNLGVSVGLIDADVSTPNTPEVLGGEDVDFDNSRLSTGNSLVAPEVNGVQVISKGIALPDDVAVLRDGRWRSEVVIDYIQNVEWADDTELVVIDSPPGSGEELQVVVSESPITRGFIVTTPHPSSIRDAQKTHEFFEHAELPHDLITNMAYLPSGDVVDHVLSTTDMDEIQGVGPAKSDALESLMRDDTEHFPLFGNVFEEPPDIGITENTVVPYTEDFEKREAIYTPLVKRHVGGEEVEA